MDTRKLDKVVYFRKIIAGINDELRQRGIFDCEYMLINNSIKDVIHLLEDESKLYNYYQNTEKSFSEYLECYFECVKKYYDNLLIKGMNTDKVADKYLKKLKEPTKKDGEYVQYDRSNIGLIMNDVSNTIRLMREAVLTYYKVYHNKKLLAELIYSVSRNNELLEFQIKEEQLLHLLGVNINQLRNNSDFQRLTGRRYMNSREILEWIVRDSEGKNDLLQYSEDFLKHMVSNMETLIPIVKEQYALETTKQLINYCKARSKSQTFLKYGPFEKVSLVAKLRDGKKLSVNSQSDVAMITRAESFKKYPWAYFGSASSNGERYIETLQIGSGDEKKKIFLGSKPAIIKGVYLEQGSGDNGDSGVYQNVFSEDEQLALLIEAMDEFGTVMDFKELLGYFDSLCLSSNINNGKRTK